VLLDGFADFMRWVGVCSAGYVISISFVGAVIINRSQQKTIPYPLVIYILRGVIQ
jgi:hypothetical protein